MVVHAKIDDFIKLVMNELHIQIPQFYLSRWFSASLEESKTGKETLKIKGITEDGAPYDIFKSQKIDGKIANSVALTEE